MWEWLAGVQAQKPGRKQSGAGNNSAGSVSGAQSEMPDKKALLEHRVDGDFISLVIANDLQTAQHKHGLVLGTRGRHGQRWGDLPEVI